MYTRERWTHWTEFLVVDLPLPIEVLREYWSRQRYALEQMGCTEFKIQPAQYIVEEMAWALRMLGRPAHTEVVIPKPWYTSADGLTS